MLFSTSFSILVAFFFSLATLVFSAPTATARGKHTHTHGASTPTQAITTLLNGIGIPISNVNAANTIANRYIVVYHNNATDDDVTIHQASVAGALRKRELSGVAARSLDGRRLSSKLNTFSMGGWRGMALDADDAMILDIYNANAVKYIEADTVVSNQALVQQTTAPNGLNRISHAATGAASYIFDNSAGAGIVAYVVDTGIRLSHSEFGGRAIWGANFVNTNDTDENGHGSHVAGTIGGATYGVAKGVSLVAVKVLDADGAGTNSGLIAGLDFVAANVTARGLAGKAVVNVSIGGSMSAALNSAVAGLTNAGIPVTCAAGNAGVDAGNTSPASAPTAITVGAIDATTDAIASFSNFGANVDIFAPGVSILSVGIDSDTASATLSGTSMSSPHVAGLSAYLMALEGITSPTSLIARIQQLAGITGAAVSGANSATTTLIAYNGDGY